MSGYTKNMFLISLLTVASLAAFSLGLTACQQTVTTSDNTPKQGTDTGPVPSASSAATSVSPSATTETPYQTRYERVTVDFLSDNRGFKSTDHYETTDLKMVAAIDSVISHSMTAAAKTDLKNNYTYEYAIKLTNNMGGYSAGLYYDTLYNKAYLVNNGGLWQADTDFARYVDSLLENTPKGITSDDAGAVDLFKSYGWTLDYRINELPNKLGDVNALYNFNPNTYYFAYNNELSKDIGLDLSGYRNSADLVVAIYRIHEPLPKEFYPIINCRGIAVKKGGKIIGAFISAGRHSAFLACSLKGNSFEKASGQTVSAWLAEKVKADGAEVRLSKLAPEQVIEEYFKALENKDASMAGSCVSKVTLLGNLTANMPNGELFNEGIGLPLTSSTGAVTRFDNLKSAKLLEVKLIDEPEKNVKRFSVNVNLQYNKVIAVESGAQSWDCTMVYESPQTGWKIKGFGHG